MLTLKFTMILTRTDPSLMLTTKTTTIFARVINPFLVNTLCCTPKFTYISTVFTKCSTIISAWL
jgi:hypothetical protein